MDHRQALSDAAGEWSAAVRARTQALVAARRAKEAVRDADRRRTAAVIAALADGWTLSQIAAELGVSRSRVQQIAQRGGSE